MACRQLIDRIIQAGEQDNNPQFYFILLLRNGKIIKGRKLRRTGTPGLLEYDPGERIELSTQAGERIYATAGLIEADEIIGAYLKEE